MTRTRTIGTLAAIGGLTATLGLCVALAGMASAQSTPAPTLTDKDRAEIRQLQRRLGVTSLFVTHDQVEAMTLGDRLLVMHQGQPAQLATPMEVFARPADTYVTAAAERLGLDVSIVSSPLALTAATEAAVAKPFVFVPNYLVPAYERHLPGFDLVEQDLVVSHRLDRALRHEVGDEILQRQGRCVEIGRGAGTKTDPHRRDDRRCQCAGTDALPRKPTLWREAD